MTLREPVERRSTGNDDRTGTRCRGIAFSQGTLPDTLKPGAVKGRRLFHVQSVRDFLARQMKGGAQ